MIGFFMRFKTAAFSIIIIICFFINQNGFASNDTIYVSKNPVQVNIKDFASVYLSEEKVSLTSIDKELFKKINDGRYFFYFGFNNQTIVLKLIVKNTTNGNQKLYLQFSNALINEVKAHKIIANDLQELYKDGIKYPFSNRQEENKNFIFPLELKGNERGTYLISFNKKQGRPLVTSAYLYDRQVLDDRNNHQYITIGIYVGLTIICLIAGLSLFFSLKKLIYLFYVLYVLFLSLFNLSYTGFFQQYFLDENTILNKYLHYAVFSELALVLFIIFSQKFLQTKKHQPIIYKIIISVLSVAVVLRLLLHFFFEDSFTAYIPVIMKVWYGLNIVGTLLVAYQIIASFQKDKKRYFLFALAYLVMVTGSMVSILYHSYGVVNGIFNNLPILLYTSLLEIVLLTVALGFLIKDIFEEKSNLLLTVEKQKQQNLSNFIELNNKTKVYLDSLVYIKSDGNYIEFFTDKDKVLDRNQLKALQEKLPTNFIRVHRSYIINKNYIKAVSSTSITLLSNLKIPLSRTFKKNIKS